jgi:N-formylglutamate deformylase
MPVSDESRSSWLTIHRGDAPLITSMPHTGVDIPARIEADLVSAWLARKDADWWIDRLYDFAQSLGATVIRTAICRTVIDVNRDPSGASLYPGQATTELCPTTTFDGEPLYRAERAPDAQEIAARRTTFFEPYHHAIENELARLRVKHPKVVLYDCHSIRSHIPRLFEGMLPHFNIGTNDGATCDPTLSASIERICKATSFTSVINGRFKGGYTTRHYGRPLHGVHAIQMELACRGYLHEPAGAVLVQEWPAGYDDKLAAPMRGVLTDILQACVGFASGT